MHFQGSEEEIDLEASREREFHDYRYLVHCMSTYKHDKCGNLQVPWTPLYQLVKCIAFLQGYVWHCL